MIEYKPVHSSIEIIRTLFDCLAVVNHRSFTESNRVYYIRLFQKSLQRRGALSLEPYIDILVKRGDMHYAKRADELRRWIQDFYTQRALLTRPCENIVEGKALSALDHSGDHRQLREVEQAEYDEAVKNGFPRGFFQCASFFAVKFYCLPDKADFTDSWLANCEIAVCRIAGACFERAHIYDSQFHTCRLQQSAFNHANIAHTHFRDSWICDTQFQHTRLKACNTIDCSMENDDYSHSTLDGCFFSRVNANQIRGLLSASITVSGATEEECAQNRASILAALHAA